MDQKEIDRIFYRDGYRLADRHLGKEISTSNLKAACPFLESGSCLAYETRPMACRIYLSSSVRSCKAEHDHPRNQQHHPGLFEFPLQAGRMLNEGFVACLKQKALQVAELPIEQAYSSLVTLGQTMEDWVNSRPQL